MPNLASILDEWTLMALISIGCRHLQVEMKAGQNRNHISLATIGKLKKFITLLGLNDYVYELKAHEKKVKNMT